MHEVAIALPRFPAERVRAAVLAAGLLASLALPGCGGDAPVAASACGSAGDCAWLGTGDPCAGSFACVAGRCAFDPSTVVTCDPSADTACQAARCQPEDGTCALTPRNEGLPCDDGAPCTLGDLCKAGGCLAGATNACDCATSADCADDSDLCNGSPLCDTSTFPFRCVTNPATVVACKDDGDPCTVESCDPKSGKCGSTPAADGATCNDGDPCTSGDVCVQGACAGPKLTCGCKSDGDCPDLDGDPCTGVPYCDAGSGKGVCKINPATIVTCSSKADTACRKNTCSKLTGACALTAVKEDTPCDDGDPCTKGEVCVGGSCAAGTDTCTCSSDKDCAGKDDGDLCNGLPFCNKASGKCETNPATLVVCPTVDDTACAKTVCVPKTGSCTVLARAAVKSAGCVEVDLGGGIKGTQCLWVPADAPSTAAFVCDDGDACTVGDACAGTTCKAGKTTCECTTDAQCALKDDGDLCNGVAVCDTNVGKCVANPASVVFCDKAKDSACLKAACDPKTGSCGLKPEKAGQDCDDGKPCTSGDSCTAKGACVGAKATACDDQDPCTVDVCKPGQGCSFAAKSCADGNACTLDGCDSKTGACKSGLVAKGTSCNADSDGCTVGDACDGQGSCVVGSAAICVAKTGACETNACQSKGVDGFSCAVVKVADQTPCADDDPCFVGATCQGGTCKPGGTATLFAIAPTATGAMTFEAGLLTKAAAPKAAGDGTGVAVLAGTLTTGPQANTWRVLAVDQAGKTLWDKNVKPPAGVTKLVEIVAMIDRGKLGVVVVGRGETSAKAARAVSVVIDLAGQVSKPVIHQTDQGAPWALAVDVAAAHPSGGVVLAGRLGATTISLGLRSLSGAPQWSIDLPTAAPIGPARGVTAAKDGRTTLAIERLNPQTGKPNGYTFLQVSAVGKAVWELSQSAAGSATVVIQGMAQTSTKLLHVLLKAGDAQGSQVEWLSVDDADGAEVLLKRPWGAATVPTFLQVLGERMAWIAPGAKGGSTFGLADGLGNVLWQRTLASAPSAPNAIAPAADGERFVLLGGEGSGPQAKPRAVIVDRWGVASCGTRGACAAKGWSDCDDASDCSADSCDPVLGCVHAPKAQNVCDPQLACTSIGRCATGSCKALHNGRVFMSGRPYHPGITETGAGATLDAKGHVRYWTHLLHPASKQAWVAPGIVDVASGKIADLGEFMTPGMTAGARVVRQGTSLAVAGLVPAASPQRFAMIRFAGDNPQPLGAASAYFDTCTTCALQFVELVGSKDGGYYVVGLSAQFGGKGLIFRTDAQGKQQWLRALGQAGTPRAAYGAVARADGGLIHVGVRATNVGVLPELGWVAANNSGAGAVVDSLAKNGSYLAAAERGDLSVVAVGEVLVGSVKAQLAGAYTAAGKLLWRKQPNLADGVSLNNVVPVDHDGLVVAGRLVVAGQSAARVERWTSSGAVVWSRTQRREGVEQVAPDARTLLRLKTGGFALAADMAFYNNTYAGYGIVRTDASGHMSCLDSGACAALKTGACDDDNPCTTDWCDPKTQCLHSKLSGVACGAGGTCKAGVCSQL